MNFLKKFLEVVGATGGVPLKYGPIRGNISAVVDGIPMAASVAIKNDSGHFITLDASGYGALTSVGAATIFGWVEGAAQTTSATAGTTKLPCIVAGDCVFRLPVSNAYTAGATNAAWIAKMGYKCDLRMDSSGTIQGVNMDSATAGGHVIIVGQDAWVAAPASTSAAAITASTGCRWVDVIINTYIQGK